MPAKLISYSKGADTDKSLQDLVAYCTTKTIKDNKNTCNIGLDWSFYLQFYNQQMRGDDNFMFKKTRRKCRDTNMVALSIDYLTGKRGGSSRIFTVFNKRVQHKKRKNTKKNVQY